jgi:hypothetical protein
LRFFKRSDSVTCIAVRRDRILCLRNRDDCAGGDFVFAVDIIDNVMGRVWNTNVFHF